jgi:hypothetical protein
MVAKAPRKVPKGKKLKGPAPIVAGSIADRFRPGTPVVIAMRRGTESFWVSGYEVWDPTVSHRVTGKKGGEVALAPKGSALMKLRVIKAGQVGKTQRLAYSEVLPTSESTLLGIVPTTFEALYGGHGTIASTPSFVGFAIDGEDETLNERGSEYGSLADELA